MLDTDNPAQRQVLVNLGNRYVIFGPQAGLPQSLKFDPETESQRFPRVADESLVAEARIVETAKASGLVRADAPSEPEADVVFTDSSGTRVLIEVKVRERDPKQREYDESIARLREAAERGVALEVWLFNTERLGLHVMWLQESQIRIDELSPLEVWETGEEGLFRRSRVIEGVESWLRRVTNLYDDVRRWLADRPGLRFDQSRTVVMAEQLMQQFAVPDREVPILDLIEGDRVVASFVPRGLWLIGASGRIDVITSDRTTTLIGVPITLEWRVVSTENRRETRPLNQTALLSAVGFS